MNVSALQFDFLWRDFNQLVIFLQIFHPSGMALSESNIVIRAFTQVLLCVNRPVRDDMSVANVLGKKPSSRKDEMSRILEYCTKKNLTQTSNATHDAGAGLYFGLGLLFQFRLTDAKGGKLGKSVFFQGTPAK